jgi:hypothetical protein
MKITGIVSTAILSLLIGIAAPAYAQEEQQGEKQRDPAKQAQPDKKDRPENEPGKQPEAKPENKQDKQEQAKPEQQQLKQNEPQQPRAEQQQRQEQNKPQEHAQQPQGKPEARTPEQQHVQQAAWQQHRSTRWDSDHRTWQQRGGYTGYRIPDDRFRGYFGPDHGFRIYGLPFLVVGGYPRFQYSGYWFSLVDPWPEYWANDWYDTDDVYVAYVDNGYYLFDRRYPTVGIAINISM